MCALSPETRLVLGTGVLSSFTTYSTFAFETVRLAEEGHLRRAATNGATNLLGALLAVGLGAGVATLL